MIFVSILEIDIASSGNRGCEKWKKMIYLQEIDVHALKNPSLYPPETTKEKQGMFDTAQSGGKAMPSTMALSEATMDTQHHLHWIFVVCQRRRHIQCLLAACKPVDIQRHRQGPASGARTMTPSLDTPGVAMPINAQSAGNETLPSLDIRRPPMSAGSAQSRGYTAPPTKDMPGTAMPINAINNGYPMPVSSAQSGGNTMTLSLDIPGVAMPINAINNEYPMPVSSAQFVGNKTLPSLNVWCPSTPAGSAQSRGNIMLPTRAIQRPSAASNPGDIQRHRQGPASGARTMRPSLDIPGTAMPINAINDEYPMPVSSAQSAGNETLPSLDIRRPSMPKPMDIQRYQQGPSDSAQTMMPSLDTPEAAMPTNAQSGGGKTLPSLDIRRPPMPKPVEIQRHQQGPAGSAQSKGYARGGSEKSKEKKQ